MILQAAAPAPEVGPAAAPQPAAVQESAPATKTPNYIVAITVGGRHLSKHFSI